MKVIGVTLKLCILMVSICFSQYSCVVDNEKYDNELTLDISDGGGNILYQLLFKYPASLKYDKDIDNAVFVDEDILRVLANDPEGWGYGCYCAFKTLIKPDLLANDKSDYENASAIMLRRLEVECFPSWMYHQNFEEKLLELQKATTERILTKSGYEISDWKILPTSNINGINVYTYTYTILKGGKEVRNKVACFIKDKYTCELSLRCSADEYKEWAAKFDKIVATVELNKAKTDQQ